MFIERKLQCKCYKKETRYFRLKANIQMYRLELVSYTMNEELLGVMKAGFMAINSSLFPDKYKQVIVCANCLRIMFQQYKCGGGKIFLVPSFISPINSHLL